MIGARGIAAVCTLGLTMKREPIRPDLLPFCAMQTSHCLCPQLRKFTVELKAPLGRVQTAIKTHNIPQQSFPPDRRLRYYSPEAIQQITPWLSNK